MDGAASDLEDVGVTGSARSTAAHEELAERLRGAVLSTVDVLTIVLGDRLGYYRCLAQRGPMTAAALASATGTAQRYTREWLEQQAVTGLVQVTVESDGRLEQQGPAARSFALAPGVESVLADPDSGCYLAPLARQVVTAGRELPLLVDAYRAGHGVPWSAYGADMREAQADLNRHELLTRLAPEWLAALPDVVGRLRSLPAARVADIGCGAAWSSIGLARAFPNIQVDAYDADLPTVALALHNVMAAGLDDRVQVHYEDVSRLPGEEHDAGAYAFVLAVECVHAVPRPVELLAAMRRMLAAGGTVLVVDKRVSEEFVAPGDDADRLAYGFSTLVSLPDALSRGEASASGAVLRRPRLARYAERAGFAGVRLLPLEHRSWSFYRLDV